MNRRNALKRLTAAGSIALAGCSSAPGAGPAGTVLGRIEVINSSFVPNRIRLMVMRGEDRLVDRNISLAAIDATDGAAWTIVEPTWSQTRAQYSVHAHHVDEADERESEAWEYTFNRDDYDRYYADTHEDPGCIGAVVKIGSLAEAENAAIGISPTYVEDPC